LKPNALTEIKESALRLLARREHGAYELKLKLLERGYDEVLINEVISLFSQLDLQSDTRFAENAVRRRVAKGFGPLHITNELLKIKIDPSIIQEQIAGFDHDWKQSIQQLSMKKFGQASFCQEIENRSRQIRFLQTRGFSLSQIREALSHEK